MFSQQLKRLAGPALILGGIMWITIHIIMIIIVVMTGKLAGEVPASQQPLITPIYFLFLPLSSIFLGVGLLGLFALLEGRSRKLGIAGIVLASIGMVMGIIYLPILLVTPLPVGPIWATDTITFFIGGIGYTVVGVTLIVTRKQMAESTVDTTVNVVAQAK